MFGNLGGNVDGTGLEYEAPGGLAARDANGKDPS
jgi:hypothetical protein